jgi:hypothetical protein
MEFLELRGGLLVRADAVQLMLDLADRGHALTSREGTLRVSNGATLTAADHAAIRAMKDALMALALYEAPEPSWRLAARV